MNSIRSKNRIPALRWMTLSILCAFLATTLLPEPADAGFWSKFNKRKIRGSGVLVEKTLDLKDFDSIRIDGVADVEVAIGDEFSVVLEADEELIEYVEADVRRGTLVIDLEDDIGDIETEDGFNFVITMPALVDIQVDGVGNIVARGLDNEELNIQLEGVANIEVEGKVDRLEVELDGVAEADLRDLIAKEARISVDGVGNVTCYVEDSLDADVSGMGSVKYYGDPPRVRDRVDGFGKIARR